MNDSCSERKRIILHVDMDHFFSAVEERENPTIRSKPVVVGADPKEGKGRGVVKTCNYEARKFGIHSGMPISKAWRLCPTAVFVRSNYRLYKQISRRIMTVLKRHSDKFQQWGLDEAFLDVSSQISSFREATKLAESIKYDILWSDNLTCSVGVAPNKLVAKVASDFGKPDGLTVVTENDVKKFLTPLPVRKLLGVGEKTERRLRKMGIETIGDLAVFDVSVLVDTFGIMGRRYHQWAHGIHNAEVGRRIGMMKSIGHETTFKTDTSDYKLVLRTMNELCQRIHERAIKRSVIFKTITAKIRYEDFETFTRARTLSFFTDHLEKLQKAARELVQNHLDKNRNIRLVGLRVSNLKSRSGQKTLI